MINLALEEAIAPSATLPASGGPGPPDRHHCQPNLTPIVEEVYLHITYNIFSYIYYITFIHVQCQHRHVDFEMFHLISSISQSNR